MEKMVSNVPLTKKPPRRPSNMAFGFGTSQKRFEMRKSGTIDVPKKERVLSPSSLGTLDVSLDQVIDLNQVQLKKIMGPDEDLKQRML